MISSIDFIGLTDFFIIVGSVCNKVSLNLRLVCLLESTLIVSFSVRCVFVFVRFFLRVVSVNLTIVVVCIFAVFFFVFVRTVSLIVLVFVFCAVAIRVICLVRSVSVVWRVVFTFCWAFIVFVSARLVRVFVWDCCFDLAVIAIDFVWLAISVICCCSIFLMRILRLVLIFFERTVCSRSIFVF